MTSTKTSISSQRDPKLNQTETFRTIVPAAEKPSQRRRELNILLLGETGVGKSTFINAFSNYLTYEELDEAVQDIRCFIPSHFTVYDEETSQMKKVTMGNPNSNEAQQNGASGTQGCRAYVFMFGDIKIRLIDTPGIGDTRGVITDGKNMQNLLNFIAQYPEIHAICVLLKPNNARVSVVFKYCILQLLTHLDKSASRNIVFLFTNARGTFYRPGDTAPTLLEILKAIKDRPPYVNIEFKADTTYCLDNEAFRYLVASSPPNNIKFKAEEKREFQISWVRSTKECCRLIQYILSLPPHNVEDTISVNKARTSILLLCQPLGDIAKYIADNVKALEAHRKKIFEWEGDIEELKKNLYTPTVEIISVPLERPRTVCGDVECCDKINVNGTVKIHYKTACHNPCYLESSDGNIIGNTGLLDCQAFNKYTCVEEFRWKDIDKTRLHPDMNLTPNESGKVWVAAAKRDKSEYCNVCSHSYQVHLHIFSETEVQHTEVRDDAKYNRIKDSSDAVKAQQEKMAELESKIAQLNKEKGKITEYTAKFAHFLRHNALTPFNDAFEEYLQHLISNEKSGLDLGIDNQETVESLEKMMVDYRYEKDILERAIKENTTCEELSSTSIEECIEELCQLTICGPKIKNDYQLQKATQSEAHKVHKEIKCEVKVPSKSIWDKFKSFLPFQSALNRNA